MYSERFQDIYFQENGIEESEYVFIDGNNLKERFSQQQDLSLCELGFGTGLNFLLTSKLFLETNKQGMLFYYSIEKYPLSVSQIQKALSIFPRIQNELQRLVDLLKEIYYPTVEFQTFYFHPRIRLTLMLGDVMEMLSSFSSETFDAWYLDGFSPKKNPEMWQEGIYYKMAKHSHHGSTFATFSCARVVKVGLQKAGFIYKKRKGFHHKREMLYGYYENPSKPKKIVPPKTIAIIGAGISGISSSLFLLKRNHKVIVFDKFSDVLSGSSFIPAASIMPYISKQKNPLSSFSIKGFNFLLSFLKSHLSDDLYKKIYKKTLLYKKQNKNAIIPDFLKDYQISKTSIRKFQTFFLDRKGGVLLINYLKEALKSILFSDRNFVFHPNTEIQEIHWDKQWFLLDQRNHVYSEIDAVIFCNSYELSRFSVLKPIEHSKVRGQIVLISKKYLSSQIKRNCIFDVSLFPLENQIQIGSSFEPYLDDSQRRIESDKYILKKFYKDFKEIFSEVAESDPDWDFKVPTEAIIGFRCQSKDYLPVVGNLPDWNKYAEILRSVSTSEAPPYESLEIPNHEDLFVHACHGTRGYTTSFLSGEFLASLISHQPLPIEKYLIQNLSPARFVYRKWKSSQNRKKFFLD
ncbi:MAG: tRNA (5-methylaminomethyl-2-thiouridine)(34)-methyltransferase MnmD [Leptospiraceae bacterium]|nr:tRNA (5-methylaminomethyl-2-thiouridine)(34)-methyltransferase MnmD [Leptospiraceae bacterium]MDW7976823.1 tRNA (5-methylaminomethyl-2-thiouridine)(34)-methyltransferase MnmD [Leptospiraceae bacterium]